VYFDGILKIIITVSFIFYLKKITIYNSLNATTMTKKKKKANLFQTDRDFG
jgi:ABC-type lipoprotein release transport system permease subunit